MIVKTGKGLQAETGKGADQETEIAGEDLEKRTRREGKYLSIFKYGLNLTKLR